MSQSLVSLSPPDSLLFHLEQDSSPRTVLKVTNASSNKVAFKVKTTQPSWYFVRPNQQVVDVGQTEEVAIVLVDTECSRLLQLAAAGSAEKLDKHRFLVQTKVIDDEDYTKIVSLSVGQRSEEYTRVWNSGQRDERKNIKLKVEFKYPPSPNPSSTESIPAESSGVTHIIPPAVSQQSADTIRNRFARPESSVKHPAAGLEEGPIPSPETLYAELQNLRKKYDAVVEYTVHLTAERDTVVQRLEEAERELARETTRRRSQQVETPRGTNRIEKSIEKKNIQKGFSLLVVFLAAFICFLIGRYYKT